MDFPAKPQMTEPASPSGQAAPTDPARRQFLLVQALRALAAAAVTFYHILDEAIASHPGAPGLRGYADFMPWRAGVDIFFVISGFVIIWSSRGLFRSRLGPARFLVRRVSRILPLYWLMTTLFLASLWLAPHAIHGAIGGAWYIAASYLFIPCARPDGLVQPALGLGWTLNYEMFFYFVVAPFICLRRHLAVAGAVVVLALFVALGQAGLLHGVVLRTWSSPMLLEFCAGMGLALLPGRYALRSPWRWLLALAALILLHWQPAWPAMISQGVPAMALVAAATLGPGGPVLAARRVPTFEAWLVRLGDASYSLYLVHPFVMRGLDPVLRHVPAAALLAYVIVTLIASQIAALALHRWFERPASGWFRAVLERRLLPSIAVRAVSRGKQAVLF